MSDRERAEFDERDLALLRGWRLAPDDPLAREIVLVGRLQAERGLRTVDGRYGPHTHATLREKELPLGPELSAIVKEHRPPRPKRSKVNIASATKDMARDNAAERAFTILTEWLRKHSACTFTTQIANRLSKTPFQLQITTSTRTHAFRGSSMQDAYAQAAQAIMLEELR